MKCWQPGGDNYERKGEKKNKDFSPGNENLGILAIFQREWIILVRWRKDVETKSLPENW